MKQLTIKPTLLSLFIAGSLLSACDTSNKLVNTQEEALPSSNDSSLTKLVLPVSDSLSEIESETIQHQAQFAETLQRASSENMAAVSYMVGDSRLGLPHEPTFWQEQGAENYADFDDSGIQRVIENAVSTFSIDVDTAAYSNVRRFLNQGSLPPADAVRAEELINYFSYDYPSMNSNAPFNISTEIAPSPWNSGKHLIHIGIKAKDLADDKDLHSNLVFLVDVSGSMDSPDKLGLLKTSLKMLTQELSAKDSVALVVYAGASGLVLEATPANQTRKISAALDQLQAGGSTNGEAGIELAYALAEEAFIDGGINRVILATDGDFNVGTASVDALKELIETKRKSGISLTTLGFGTGNYNDHMMEQLADTGNGNYAYIDTINEARKVLVDEVQSTLQTVAKDVKIQIEFNPAIVAEYRLVGYENRELSREDFNNDQVDAGEIGAGHSVTAIYEIALVNSESLSVDPLRYTQQAPTSNQVNLDELAFLKLRYKPTDADESLLLEQALEVADIKSLINETSDNYRFATAVAGFAQLLRDNDQTSNLDYDRVLELAQSSKGEDEFGYRSEFIQLVRNAQALSVN